MGGVVYRPGVYKILMDRMGSQNYWRDEPDESPNVRVYNPSA
ncbi:hypothetical protein GCM10008922_48250 [Faecalicatena contorta]